MSISIEDRGAIVTESSLWVLDGHGRFRRTPRARDMSAQPLEYADWDDFALAEFVNDSFGSFRLRVAPLGRPPGAVGILSGKVLWTNMGLDSRYSDALEGSTAAWFPPSPVPQDTDLWPDELPFTAFGQFGPDYIDLRVFDQDVYWVDRNGDPHYIDSMEEEYIRNVRTMLIERATEFHSVSILRECLQSVGDALCGRVSAGVLVSDLGVGSLQGSAPQVWLHSTPLMRRLLKTR